MDSSHFNKKFNKLALQRNTLFLFSLLSSISIIFLSALLFTKKDRIVIVPTTGQSFWVEENGASSIYIEKMGLYLADLLLNRSPADAAKRNQTILEHVHPSSYQDFKKLLKQDLDAIAKGNQSFFFQTESSTVEGTVFVITGESVVLIEQAGASAVCTQKKQMRYILQFRPDHGKLLLVSMKKEEL